jgi:hypothetical protein
MDTPNPRKAIYDRLIQKNPDLAKDIDENLFLNHPIQTIPVVVEQIIPETVTPISTINNNPGPLNLLDKLKLFRNQNTK